MNRGIVAVCAYVILLTVTILWSLLKAIHQERDSPHTSQGPSRAYAPANPEVH